MQSDKKTEIKKSSHSHSSLAVIYDRVIKRVISAGLQTAEDSNLLLHKAVDEAIELEQTAQEMTMDEVHLLSQYVRRDLSMLSTYLHETGEGVAAWLNFDLNILEQSVKQQIIELADQTIVENVALNEKLYCSDVQYLTGEICALGTMKCLNCAKEFQVLKTQVIEPCGNCHSDCFERISKSK